MFAMMEVGIGRNGPVSPVDIAGAAMGMRALQS